MLKAGTVLGERYEIVGRVGSGGMADVYKAKDHKLNRFVAVKVMKSEFREDGTFISKFRREAQSAARLANPNIVNVFDVGEDMGNYYIVMELVEGITLKEYISKKGKLSVREATSIAIQVCMGLAAAHQAGIVHRDVKPQNIIISTDGKVKVTDFGIARAASSNTISANAMGSVHYSSPEQVRGGYSDSRSDIYSLGITLYEMVTGRVPFDGETTVAIAIKHLQDEMDPPSKYAPDLPYSLEQIIYKCTQKSVDRRYQSMNDVINDLKHSLVEPDGRFVTLAPLSDHARTVVITPEEQDRIRSDGYTRPDISQKTYTSTAAAKSGRELPEEEPYDDPYDESDDGLSGRLEKAMTIGVFVIGALIICVLIYFIARAAGLFSMGRGSDGGDQVAVESTVAAVSDNGPTESTSQVEVPVIVGMTESEAASKAQEANLGIKYMGEKESEEYEAGIIMEQDPVAGSKVDKNTTIYYYRSSGRTTITMPDIINMSLTDAQNALTSAGFSNLQVANAASEEVPIGNVISVSPGVGENVGPTDLITLTVSTGSENAAKVTVSSYGGLPEDQAVAALQGMGLIVRIEYGSSDRVNVGDVIKQSISSGTEVSVGTEITLTVNNPDMIGQTGAAGGGANIQTASWTTNSTLDAPSNYQGGAFRLVLQQTVNGQTVETTVDEGDYIDFPYQLLCKGAAGVSEGKVVMYELYDGDYISRASWPVVFSSAG